MIFTIVWLLCGIIANIIMMKNQDFYGKNICLYHIPLIIILSFGGCLSLFCIGIYTLSIKIKFKLKNPFYKETK